MQSEPTPSMRRPITVKRFSAQTKHNRNRSRSRRLEGEKRHQLQHQSGETISLVWLAERIASSYRAVVETGVEPLCPLLRRTVRK